MFSKESNIIERSNQDQFWTTEIADYGSEMDLVLLQPIYEIVV